MYEGSRLNFDFAATLKYIQAPFNHLDLRGVLAQAYSRLQGFNLDEAFRTGSLLAG